MIVVIFAGRLCGKTKPKSLVSLTNRLTVYFNSNERDTDKGFKAHFKAVDPSLTSGTTMSSHVTLYASCIQLAQKTNVNIYTGQQVYVCVCDFTTCYPKAFSLLVPYFQK